MAQVSTNSTINLDTLLGNQIDVNEVPSQPVIPQEVEERTNSRRKAITGTRSPVTTLTSEDTGSFFFTDIDSNINQDVEGDEDRGSPHDLDRFQQLGLGDSNPAGKLTTNPNSPQMNGASSQSPQQSPAVETVKGKETLPLKKRRPFSPDVNSTILLSGVKSEPGKEGKMKSELKLPGGLGLSQDQTAKYFGVEARQQFYEQMHNLQKTRAIFGTSSELPAPPELIHSIGAARGGKDSKVNKELQDLPFHPNREPPQLKLNTRVIIRTQSLAAGESYAQMKLIQKPAHLKLEEQHHSSSGSESEEEDHTNNEEKNKPFPANPSLLGKNPPMSPFSPLKKPGMISTSPLVKGQSPQLIGSPKGTFSPKGSNPSKSPHALKLKPLPGHQAPHVQTSARNSRRNSKNSVKSSDGDVTPNSKKKLAPIKKEADAKKKKVPDQEALTTATHENKPVAETKSSETTQEESGSSTLETDENTKVQEDAEAEGLPTPTDNHESDRPTISISSIGSLYQEHISLCTIQEEKVRKKKKTHAVGELDDVNIPGMELICIDHRDPFNKKVADKLKKGNSLFKYVEAKMAKKDFYDKDDESDNSDVEDEIKMWDTKSSLSPVHILPPSKLIDPKAATRRRFGKKNSRIEEKDTLSALNASGANSESTMILSPRSHFIDNCIRQKLNPRASLILRKSFTRSLNLKHLGMGNEMAVLLAEAIINVPYIESLNVCDNNLSDKGLSAIVHAICNMSALTELDMSYNEIGPDAASALNTYLSSSTCPLESLVLQKADVDDDECRDFVTALLHNTKLRNLDLCENKIGSSENLNTVMPDLVTGGEALADLLQSPNCPLTSLKLGWNLIRLDGSAALCESLAFNTSLTYLELSYNSLGASGGVALGNSLQDNKVLKTLYVANNSLDSIACLTICSGILENEALEFVSFDGNPIGEQGAKALMLLPTIVGSRVKVSAKNCNISIRDANNWFDTSALVRKFELDLSNPFDRAVAIILTYLIPSHQTYVVAFCEYFDPENKTWIDLKMKETVDKHYYDNRPLEPEQARVIEGLKKVLRATKDKNKAIELFKEMDEDGSGELDEEEFRSLLHEIGMEVTEGKVQEIMAEYDVDGGGVIELTEFLLFLKSQQKEAKKRLKELTEFPILVSEEWNAEKRFLPPREGTLRMTIIDGFHQKETYRVISPGDRSNIMKVAQQSGELLTMTSFGMKNYKIRYDEAVVMVNQLMKETSNKVKVLATILPQMSTPADARMLVAKVLGQNLLEIARLKREVGQSYRVMMGQPDGFYCLDLSNDMDRYCANRLIEISMTTQHYRSLKRDALGYGRLGDTSQKGNYTCFRNEMLNHKPVTVTAEFASPLPRSGKLEFDFVSQRRCKPSNFVLNDIRFTNLLVKTFQLHPMERPKTIRHLRKVKKQSERTLFGDGRTVYEIPKQVSLDAGLASQAFYDKLAERTEQYDKFRNKENVKAQWEYDANALSLDMNTAVFVYEVPFLYKNSAQKYPKIAEEDEEEEKDGDEDKEEGSDVEGSVDDNNNKDNKDYLNNKFIVKPFTEITRTRSNADIERVENETTLAEEVLDSYDETTPPARPDTAVEEVTGELAEGEGKFEEDEMAAQEHEEEPEDDSDDDFDIADRSELLKVVSNTPAPASKAAEANESGKSIKPSRATFIMSALSVNKPEVKPVTPAEPQLTPMQIVQKKIEKYEKKMMKSDASVRNNKPLSEIWNKYVCLMGSKNIPSPAKAAKTLELLVETFETLYFFSRHLELMLLLFKDLGSLKTSDDFGTYRVELVVQLFGCIVDLHNFELVLRQLTAYEIGCVYCRLGILNIFNPMKPEGSYELDLSRRDDRMIVKMLAQLAVIEPGDNLPFIMFRWERTMDPMPGYELTENWLTEDGLPRKGLWNATYYSGEGKGKKGCKPVAKLRKSLMQLVLIEEEEMITEKERDAEVTITPVGPSFIKANLGMWWGYLAYDENEFKAYKDKKGGGGDDKKKDGKKK